VGRLRGIVFRRQVVIGSRLVDFLALAAMLVVEVDGDAYHAERAAADGSRDEALGRAGYRVLRLPASLVERRLGEAVALVRDALLR
jgi:very-short-patch-repair endonuclease